ncbi:divalent-cation tolerance protein CutA [Leptolyngbya sp. FACHB-17]|uniref:divalent-cation tolerance protein CutA n=1 Tax=unclassified Leptolyngbya TaxID=2650499 RepID=UPI0016807F3C|nr:divalent-cation tolerance protein CutA [Leptolyngbya sp. FACHB-17]MBD2078587.1 divalent-cation tolerance protein CutA [Leptolyngbya sp. FACHB-17]
MAEATYGVVFVTAASKSEAETLARSLVSAKLAACVTLFPVQSIYTWQDELEYAEEWQLMIKTDLDRFAALEAKIRELHSYEIPEIIALPIVAGSHPYLQWMSQQVTSR